MKSIITLIKSDYLQRTRSYAFLITLCASLAIGYTFVPAPSASYSTISIDGYVGIYNAAWFGYVTAIMTSVFLSLIGFYLISSGIKKDKTTRVGQIIAATPLSNFRYLLAKALSNFLLLLTIVFAVFVMSIILYVLYNEGGGFQLVHFVKPYLLITIPAIFFIAVLGVVLEVLLGRYSVLQNICFFFLFAYLMTFSLDASTEFSTDFTGSKIVIDTIEKTVKSITNSEGDTNMNIGYSIKSDIAYNKFNFEGMDFPVPFVISRLAWILFGMVLIAMIAPFFHRFKLKESVSLKKLVRTTIQERPIKEVQLSRLPISKTNYGIFPLLKTEFLLLIKNGKKWLWFVNIAAMALLIILPIKVSHQMVLPVLWFLQVSRLSSLSSKEITNNIHYFTSTSYKPISRLFVSQVSAGIILMVGLALPLIIRLLLLSNFSNALAVVFGGSFIVLLAVVLGLLSKGKKLFEVLFFMIAYTNINSIAFTDYFGGLEHHSFYLIQLVIVVLILGSLSFLIRKSQLRN